MSAVKHTMYIGPPVFPVFNDRELANDPITDADVVPFIRSDNADMNFAASAAWNVTSWHIGSYGNFEP